jgi:hypothetical protein
MNILKKGSLTYDPREIVETLIDKKLSERRACGALQINQTAQRYRQKEDSVNETIREEILQLAKRHRRYGTPRMTWLLQKRCYRVNHKRVERLYALEELQLPRKRAKKKYIPTGWFDRMRRPSRTRFGRWILFTIGPSIAGN